MGRHTKFEQSDDEPVPDAQAPAGPFFGAPHGSSYEAFSSPTDDQVFVASYEREPAYEQGIPGGHQPDARIVPEPDADRPDPPSRPGTTTKKRVGKLFSLLPVPLLPIVALVVAVGVVAYALSTQQISLNFAGGAPKDPARNAHDSQVSQRGPGERASRGGGRPDGLVVEFRVVSRAPGGFKATATIVNQGQAPVARWALAFKIRDASVRALSGATVVRTGSLAFVRGRTGIAPGRSVRIVFTARGTATKPYYCLLNHLACALV
ncbi:cellulose binding domain-containing protein [Actinomadura rubrisoli]|uniref:CBM2 domain-containing protein n=1 Tax=Actinomadura rubrisoli TaxID=2530368 RepID=A0A4R5AF32_9ACTN|nr:cellulose binding domain-containing protein [Actinomadura rubrisoli]TDD68552.1 hypothetical protein E1298_38335 [Actinomadura rubrisoli]